MRRQYKRLIESKRGKDKDNQEGAQNFMITTTATVQEVCVVDEGQSEEKRING